MTNDTDLNRIRDYVVLAGVFKGLIKEVRDLSKKKPNETLNASKVKILNRILKDVQILLVDEPEGKYLDLLDDDILPQASDCVLVMVQFESALTAFKARNLHAIVRVASP